MRIIKEIIQRQGLFIYLENNPPTQPNTMSGRTSHRNAKTCHRVCLFANADFADSKKLNLLKTEKNGMTVLNKYLKPMTEKNNAQFVTKAKIKRAESANLKGSTTNKLNRRLTVKCSEMPASF